MRSLVNCCIRNLNSHRLLIQLGVCPQIAQIAFGAPSIEHSPKKGADLDNLRLTVKLYYYELTVQINDATSDASSSIAGWLAEIIFFFMQNNRFSCNILFSF